jgi:hypothetical protein
MNATLVVLAAGMSTRYGRFKQLEPVGPGGESLLDYSVFDALKAGFRRVVMVIRREIEDDVRRHLDGRWPEALDVVFHRQDLGDLPGVPAVAASSRRGAEGAPVPGEAPESLARLASRRRKPWGTAHAVLTAREFLSGPFAVINADDFYGASAFTRAAGLLEEMARGEPGGVPLFGLLTYVLEDTLSGHGGVSRGICRLEGTDRLREVEEVMEIRREAGAIRGRTLSGNEFRLVGNEPVSTNFWLLFPEVLPLLEEGFLRFLGALPSPLPGAPSDRRGAEVRTAASPALHPQPEPESHPAADPTRRTPAEPEFLLPSEMNRILAAGQARVRVAPGGELFLGITHPQDRDLVAESLANLVREGRYPRSLWPLE